MPFPTFCAATNHINVEIMIVFLFIRFLVGSPVLIVCPTFFATTDQR